MYGDDRNPRLFLEVIKELENEGVLQKDNFQFVYAGKDTQLWVEWMNKLGLTHYFSSRGLVSMAESKHIQNVSHINLLLTSATPEWSGVMTGKFYEYLSAKRPIIVLINGTQDLEFETIVSNLNAGCVVYNDRSHDELRTFILNHFSTFQKTGDIEPTIRLDQLKTMDWAFQTEALMNRINQFQ